SCCTRGPSGGTTAAAARGGAPPAPAFESFNGRADALYVVNYALVVRTTLTPGRSLHDCQQWHGTREVVEAGGLISMDQLPRPVRARGRLYGQDVRGAKPGDIPVERPTKFDLVVNLTTAKMLA